MKKLSSQDRDALLRLASTLDQGDELRKTILSGLIIASRGTRHDRRYLYEGDSRAKLEAWGPGSIHMGGWSEGERSLEDFKSAIRDEAEYGGLLDPGGPGGSTVDISIETPGDDPEVIWEGKLRASR